MAVFGHVGVFDEKLELFADYADRCDAFIAANDVAEEKRANFFLAVVGVIAYRLLKDLCSPNLPNTKSYGDLKKLLQDHYSPRPIVIAERHRFWTATQGENKSISCFIVRLKTGQPTHRFKGKAHGSRGSFRYKCKGCGGEHKRADCPYKEVTCHNCKRKGHLQRVCRSGGQHGSSENTNTRHRGGLRPNHFKAGHANTKHVADGNQEAEDSVYLDGVQDERYQSEGFGLYNVTSNYSVSPYMIRMSVGKGKADNISMEIDTGATRSTISESAYMSELANMYPLKKCDFALRSYTGELIPTLGYVSVPVKFKSSPSHLADIIVVQGKCPSLFGRDLLQKINLDWNQIFTVKSEPQLRQKGQNHLGDIGALRKSEIVLPTCQPCDPEGFRELLEKHRKLFSDKDTGIKDFTASLKLKPNAKSTYTKV
ncbi:hypothetical protein BSL78_15954 [Apostichopus japonicus]|uniref:Peptidase A2 domain-containing protein n=1 Tax=Stichopus japonicus TaxID=307972 RepID=A0A2G8KGR0_STIJA|nr:hypothetical protein BSL78_15954 [Apostichopus japonicus]